MRAYAVISVNTDHQVRDVDRVFASRSDAEEYCRKQIEEHYQDIVESEHTHQKDDYLYSNGVDSWGLEIVRTEFVDGE